MKLNKFSLLCILFVFAVIFCSCAGKTEKEAETVSITPSGSETEPLQTEPQTEAETLPPVIPNGTKPHTPHIYTPDREITYPYYPPVYTLMYHLIMEEPLTESETDLYVRPSEFDEHLTAFESKGLQYKFAYEYDDKDRNSVFLTFDDGYEDNYTNMFPILKAHNAKATIFVITDMIDTEGYLTTEQIREMAQSGLVYFGSHTKTHRFMSGLTPDEIRAEAVESIHRIEAVTGQYCTAIAYPSGKYSTEAIDIISEYFDFAFIQQPAVPAGYNGYYTIPRVYAARNMTGETLMKRLGLK